MRAPEILVVDDEPLIRQVLELILGTLKYKVITASHGREGIMTFNSCSPPPNVILSDVRMPEMDGVEMVLALKRQPGFSTNVVFMTGDPGDHTWDELQRLSVAVIHKPFGMPEVVTAIEKALGRTSA